jgi:hypothetical protein
MLDIMVSIWLKMFRQLDLRTCVVRWMYETRSVWFISLLANEENGTRFRNILTHNRMTETPS